MSESRTEADRSEGAGTPPIAPREAVLLVDDDPHFLRSLERVLSVHYLVTTADSAAAALRLIEGGSRFAVVVSDLMMPGMSGVELLSAVREAAPDTTRILFTGQAQLADSVRAVNEGEVFRVLLKPSMSSTVMTAVRAGVRQNRLLVAERTILEETVHGAVEALADVLAIAQPAAHGRAIRLKRHVSDLAAHEAIQPRWDMEVAALLSSLGCVGLSSELIDRWYRQSDLTPVELAQTERIPKMSVDLIAHIPRLETVREIIRRQHEPADTVGLPVGAKLLAIARDFDLLIAEGTRAEEALSIMATRGERYDQRLLKAFRELRNDAAPGGDIREVFLADVRPGMIFAADVHSPIGVLLIARGQHVSKSLRERITQQWSPEFTRGLVVRVVTP